jgi:hypothetical protein
MKKTLSGCVLAFSLAAMLSVFAAMPAGAQDEKKQPSDRVVDFLKTFVVGFLIPEELERQDGTKLDIDRSDPKEMKKFDIPREDMRRIIRIAYNGATAEICDRMDLQEAAFAWMQLNEINKKKWSEHQLFFISRLYLATIMWQTGKASVGPASDPKEKQQGNPDNAPQIADGDHVPELKCTDARKKQVEKLEAFLKTQSG